MGAMDARRLELYELLKPKLDEAPARALVLALGPEPENLATKDDLRTLESRMEAGFARLETVLTRRMITILGGWTILVGSTVGWVSALLR